MSNVEVHDQGCDCGMVRIDEVIEALAEVVMTKAVGR